MSICEYEELELRYCEFGIPSPYPPDFINECGEIAEYFVYWGDREEAIKTKNCMYVCEEHLNEILDAEERRENEN